MPSPVPASGPELCLQFLAGPGRFAATELNAIKQWWRTTCKPGEDLVAFFTRHGIFHDQSAVEIEPIERGHVSFTSIHHLFSPGGMDRLRELSKPYHDSEPKSDTQLLRRQSSQSPPDAATELESSGTQLLSTLPIVRRQPDGEPAAHAAELPAGMTLGAFRLIRRIGRGVKGVVYEAEEVLLNRRVAVKVLAPEMAARGPAWAERFLQEARIASRVEHPLILDVYSVGRQDGLVYFAMPLMRRGSAKDALKAHGPYAPIEATRIVRQAALALAAAHAQRLSHGNLKPSNIFIGDGGAVKIADFAVPHLPLEARGGPENATGTTEVREQHIIKDLRHLGGTYYWLLTGKPPARAAEEQVPLPDACGRIIASALAPQDSQGFASAAEMADALADAEDALRGTDTLHLAGLKEALSGITAQSNPTARVGERLGKCVLTEQLGQGKTGAVYRAWHPTLNIAVAVKVLRTGGDRALYRQVKCETHLLAQLNHPHIVRVWDFQDDPALPYLIMEHVEGPTLTEVIRRGGQMQAGPAVRIVTQIASALAAAQKLGIIHRDVKPGNILLTQDGKNQKERGTRKEQAEDDGSALLPSIFCPLPFAKLTDLGLGGFLDPAKFTSSTPGPVGAVAYMAPEQASGSPEIDHRGDIYSLGATFYHLVAGRVPFPGASAAEINLKHTKDQPQPPHELAPHLPAAASSVILKMLAKDPAGRYQSYDDLFGALATLDASLPAVKGPVRSPP